jgi:pathogenicity locus Cdd1 protein
MSHKMKRATLPVARQELRALEELPNIGPSLAESLRAVGVRRPKDLVGKDPFALYDSLCRATRSHQDPCVLDTFISAVRFMEGAPARPWWYYTSERKRALAAR